MMILLSPTKIFDERHPSFYPPQSEPIFQKKSQILRELLRQLSPKELETQLKISPSLAQLNYERYQEENPLGFSGLSLFKGESFKYLKRETFTPEEIEYSQKYLRIFSGLYGLLRPLDNIHPYRLEMTNRLNLPESSSLYDFWRRDINDSLSREIEKRGGVCLNLASDEYFRTLQTGDPLFEKIRFITPLFKERRGDTYKTISTSAKQARGRVARFVIAGRLTSYESLLSFREEGYRYMPNESRPDQPHFYRDPPKS